MIPVRISIKSQGYSPARMRGVHAASAKVSWNESAIFFHATMQPKRFTHAHATAAKYTPRSPKYLRRKLQKFGHTYPLVFSGKAERGARTANITATSSSARIAYPGARVFNFRNPKSQVNMLIEFSTILQSEADTIGAKFDADYEQKINADKGEEAKVL